MDFEQRYRAIAARDRRFDGQFITAVRTTRIYCRPSCPARTPRAENVTFFSTSAAAHQAGYRACKRCLPEAVPGTPEWNLRDDLVGRAMRLIADGEIERGGVAGLAARLGYTSRHVTRVLSDELGAGPLALARALRAQTARTLLVSTDMSITDVAFAAGFASVRQFNQTIGEVFELTPTAIRSSSAAGRPANGRVVLRLATREPFDSVGVFRYLAERADPNVESAVESAVESRYSRAVALPRGRADLEVRSSPSGLQLSARLDELRDLPVLIARVRRMFDLDADPDAIDSILGRHPALAGQVHRRPGVRLPGAVDAGELVTRAAAGETHGRAARPSDLAAAAHREDVQKVAAMVDSGWPAVDLVAALASVGAPEASRAYAVSRILGAPDVDCSADPRVRAGMRALDISTGAAGSLSPWRSYAAMHFCAAAPTRRAAPPRPATAARRTSP